MARLTDHDIRDAEDALRKELSLVIGLYVRRMAEMGKAHIQQMIETAQKEGQEINGTAIGREAAERAAKDYFGGLAGASVFYETLESATPQSPELETSTHI